MTTPSRPAATAVPAPLWLTAKYRVLNSAADGLELAPHFAKSLLRHVEAPRRILDLLNSLVRPVNKHYISSHGILPVGTKLSNKSGRAFYYTNLRTNDDAPKWQALRVVRAIKVADSLVLDRGPLRRRYNCGKAGIESG